jgi:hypothetical protein
MDEFSRRTPHAEEPAEGPDLDDDYPVDREHAADDDPDADDDDVDQRDRGAPLGGDETTEEQLTADNAAEEDTLRSLDPDDSPA